MVDLLPITLGHAIGEFGARCLLRQCRQRLLGGAAMHHLLIGILILYFAQVETALRGDVGARLDSVGESGKAPFHLGGRF